MAGHQTEAGSNRQGQRKARKGLTTMKKVCITFNMSKSGDIFQTCATLRVKNELAEDALKHGVDAVIMLKDTLKHIAALQGYRYAGACYLAPADVQDVEEVAK